MPQYTTFLMTRPRSCVGLVCEGTQGGYAPRKAFAVPDEPRTSEDTGGGNAPIGQEVSRNVSEVCQKGPRQVVLVLHREEFSVLNMVLPAGSDEEMASMLDLEIPSRLPVDAEQVCYGWERLGETSTGQVQIEVYWSPLVGIESLIEDLQQSGLTTLALVPTLSAYRGVLRPLDAHRPTLFIRASESDFEVVRYASDGRVLFSRGRRGEPSDSGEDEATLAELRRSLRFLDRNALESGEDLSLSLVPEALRSSLGDSIESADTASDATASRLEGILERVGRPDPYPWFPLVAAAEFLASAANGDVQRVRANMLPRAARKRREQALVRRLTIRTAAVLALLLGLLWANVWYYEYQMERQLAHNQEEIAKLAPVVKRVDAMEERIRSIRDQIDYALSPIEAIARISAVLSSGENALEGLYVERMDYQSTGRITLEGHCLNDITPWRFVEALVNSGTFRTEQPLRFDFPPYGDTRVILFHAVLAVANNPSLSPGGAEVPR